MNQTIPAGYMLIVHSWENDMDNPGSKLLTGLSREDVKFYLHFLKQFHSQYSPYSIGPGFGNENIEPGKGNLGMLALSTAYHTHPPSSPKLLTEVTFSLNNWAENPDESLVWVDDTIGTWLDGEAYRVFESAEVYYVPQDLPNTLSEFD
jgi:hypothetical protein